MKRFKKALKSKKKQKILRTIIAISVIIFIFSFSLYGLSAITRASVNYYSESSNEISSNYDIINKASKQAKLPVTEFKTLLKVKDPERLKQESDFYKDVNKNDYVLIYRSSAVIYDANQDKILKINNF